MCQVINNEEKCSVLKVLTFLLKKQPRTCISKCTLITAQRKGCTLGEPVFLIQLGSIRVDPKREENL